MRNVNPPGRIKFKGFGLHVESGQRLTRHLAIWLAKVIVEGLRQGYLWGKLTVNRRSALLKSMNPEEFHNELKRLCVLHGVEMVDMPWEEVMASKERQRAADEEAILSGAATPEEINKKNDAFGFLAKLRVVREFREGSNGGEGG